MLASLEVMQMIYRGRCSPTKMIKTVDIFRSDSLEEVFKHTQVVVVAFLIGKIVQKRRKKDNFHRILTL